MHSHPENMTPPPPSGKCTKKKKNENTGDDKSVAHTVTSQLKNFSKCIPGGLNVKFPQVLGHQHARDISSKSHSIKLDIVVFAQ